MTRCLVLLCKAQEARWAHNNVSNMLVELLKGWGASGDGDANPMLVWVVDTMGKVRKKSVKQGIAFYFMHSLVGSKYKCFRGRDLAKNILFQCLISHCI